VSSAMISVEVASEASSEKIPVEETASLAVSVGSAFSDVLSSLLSVDSGSAEDSTTSGGTVVSPSAEVFSAASTCVLVSDDWLLSDSDPISVLEVAGGSSVDGDTAVKSSTSVDVELVPLFTESGVDASASETELVTMTLFSWDPVSEVSVDAASLMLAPESVTSVGSTFDGG
jgi:hypothetical protein